ncbi:MAG TPA: rhodanese-like domain-containing protein [Kofleriaceae bacterium]|nr:rhodanese-like domain-containing protein [Kofleriaceae bacterium]
MKSAKELVAEANAVIKTLNVEEAKAKLGNPDVVFVDLREPGELKEHGVIPGSFHAPRGMLEFYIDKDHPAHKPVFSSGKHILFYCAGGVRSALAAKTAQEMGLSNCSHLGGGFKAWKDAGAPTESAS